MNKLEISKPCCCCLCLTYGAYSLCCVHTLWPLGCVALIFCCGFFLYIAVPMVYWKKENSRLTSACCSGVKLGVTQHKPFLHIWKLVDSENKVGFCLPTASLLPFWWQHAACGYCLSGGCPLFRAVVFMICDIVLPAFEFACSIFIVMLFCAFCLQVPTTTSSTEPAVGLPGCWLLVKALYTWGKLIGVYLSWGFLEL